MNGLLKCSWISNRGQQRPRERGRGILMQTVSDSDTRKAIPHPQSVLFFGLTKVLVISTAAVPAHRSLHTGLLPSLMTSLLQLQHYMLWVRTLDFDIVCAKTRYEEVMSRMMFPPVLKDRFFRSQLQGPCSWELKKSFSTVTVSTAVCVPLRSYGKGTGIVIQKFRHSYGNGKGIWNLCMKKKFFENH